MIGKGFAKKLCFQVAVSTRTWDVRTLLSWWIAVGKEVVSVLFWQHLHLVCACRCIFSFLLP